MDLPEALALIASLAGEPDMPDDFKTLAEGGFDPAFPVALAPCPGTLAREEIEGETIICGTVTVPENHAAETSFSIDLVFAVLKARSIYPEPDPLLYLHGGPGGGTVSRIEQFSGIFASVRETRDVIMFDQRAAALSGASATCRSLFDQSIGDALDETLDFVDSGETPRPSGFMGQCLAEIAATGRDISQFNTLQNALDVGAVMSALGYDTFNIYGISYGSRLTLEVLRTAPDPVRAAIIDGVAPLQIPLYNTLAVPGSEAINLLLEACSADAICNKAYPNLRAVLRDVLDRAAAGEILDNSGNEISPDLIISLIMSRNTSSANPSTLTPYLPAFIYELAAQDNETPIQDLFDSTDAQPPRADPLAAIRGGLTDTESLAVDDALALAEIIAKAEQALDASVDGLRLRLLETKRPLVRIFDDEMVAAADELLADTEKRRAALVAYAQLRDGPPDRKALRDYVTDTFPADRRERLHSIISAMSEDELAQVFASVDSGVEQTLSSDLQDFHLMIYACQESLPFNSYEDFRATNETLAWPEVGAIFDQAAREIFAACEAFERMPRPGFHDPVVSDIPVLAIGSDWDTQTAPSWPALAAQTLTNSQTFLIHEAGHAAIAYQDCVAEMAQSFLTDPMRQLAPTCSELTRPSFFVPSE